jgi:geranylgeranyl diphosphate synthase type I
MREVLEEWRPVVDREIERLLPRVIDETYLSDYFGPASYAYDSSSVERALSTPIWDLLDRGGKRWRAVVFLLLTEGFGEDPNEYLPYACIPEILHNGTIIVDDVEDNATMRRGKPALHHSHGVDVALNAGNAMYFLPLKIITHNPADLPAETRLTAYEMLMHELNRTHLGQGMDICWHNEKHVDITEQEYLEMCACKTGCLGRIVARLAAVVTGQDEDVEQTAAKFVELMSVAFQIGDDILDIETSDEDGGAFGKGVGNDIREGKKTLMIIHAANHAPPETVARMEEILWADENTLEEIQTVVDILYETGSVEYARDQAYALSEGARDHLSMLDIDPAVAEQLTEFTRYVIERNT